MDLSDCFFNYKPSYFFAASASQKPTAEGDNRPDPDHHLGNQHHDHHEENVRTAPQGVLVKMDVDFDLTFETP